MKIAFQSLCAATFASMMLVTLPPAFAQPGGKADEAETSFKAADKDGDGKLTQAEADAGMPRVAKNFGRIDKDKKGYITLEELKAMAAGRGR